MAKRMLVALLLALLLLSACKKEAPSSGGLGGYAAMEMETYGGFTAEQSARQIIRVEYGKLTYLVYARNNSITRQIIKPLSLAEYQAALAVFNDNNFRGFKDRYAPPPGVQIMDAPDAEIRLIGGSAQKTVVISPFVLQEYPANVRAVADKMNSLIEFALSMTQSEAKDIAKDWITESKTYRYDGFNLTLIDHKILESYPEQHVLTYSFTSRHGGYGDRTGRIVTQAITPHKMVVTVVSGQITQALIDDRWDELMQEDTRPTDVLLSFPLMQCLKTPWREWYERGGIQYVQAPTEEQLATDYFASKLAVQVQRFYNQTEDLITCQACGVCPTGITYFAKVSSNDRDTLLRNGWVEAGPDSAVSDQG